jgi:hypothetical protein
MAPISMRNTSGISCARSYRTLRDGPFEGHFPGTSCLATISLSLRDNSPCVSVSKISRLLAWFFRVNLFLPKFSLAFGWRWQTHLFVGFWHGNAALGRSFDETFLDEIRFIDLFDGSRIFSDRNG